MFDWLDKDGIRRAKSLIENREHQLPIVVMTGAGISAESGVPTFRGKDGLWNGERIEEVCRPEGFLNDPKKVVDFYNQRRFDMQSPLVVPNAAHLALAKLEEELGEVYIITQNVDDLHERAGSKKVFHIHGNIFKNKCNFCKIKAYSKSPIPFPNVCENCKSKNQLRPDVVFFKEIPYLMEESEILTNSSNLFLSIGTSGIVYPAAGFALAAKRKGIPCIEMNPNSTSNENYFDFSIKKRAGECLPRFCEALIKSIKVVK
jgi:NAD-dependent deacetylase